MGTYDIFVSTHSRPKAAVMGVDYRGNGKISFNTQPPEGGCHTVAESTAAKICFNTQPPEGGCSAPQSSPFL